MRTEGLPGMPSPSQYDTWSTGTPDEGTCGRDTEEQAVLINTHDIEQTSKRKQDFRGKFFTAQHGESVLQAPWSVYPMGTASFGLSPTMGSIPTWRRHTFP